MSDSLESTSGAGAPAPATLALQQLVAIAGLYPQRGQGGQALFYQGMVQTFAGSTAAFGAPPAQGQMMPIMSNTNLFSLFATNYGGDGLSAFAIPDLRGRIPVGGYPGDEDGQTLALSYVIAAEAGAVPPGTVALFGGSFAPPGWLLCDGKSYPPDDYPQLYKVIETTFGGDGGVFAVPNLDKSAAIGVGKGPGLPPVALGQQVAGTVPGLGLTAMICNQGIYPTPSGGGFFPESEPFIGQMLAFAAAEPPVGWLPADGRLLPPQSYAPLYSILGTTYGGDGATSFALPDLRGRMIVGK